MSRPLSLTRPLISFDLETTGLDLQQDRIVEISCVKLHPDGARETLTARLNPERAISPEASAVHGIQAADVALCPTFAQEAARLHAFMRDADLTGFNMERFDLPILRREFAAVEMVFPDGPVQIIDTWRIFLHFHPRDLSAAYRHYCNAELQGAHGAEADATAAADILVAQLEHHPELPQDAEGLHAFCHPVRPDWVDPDGKIVWQGDEAALAFGKHRGRTLRAMSQEEPNYLRWMAQGNFSPEVQSLCAQAIRGHYPVRPQEAAAPEAVVSNEDRKGEADHAAASATPPAPLGAVAQPEQQAEPQAPGAKAAGSASMAPEPEPAPEAAKSSSGPPAGAQNAEEAPAGESEEAAAQRRSRFVQAELF